MIKLAPLPRSNPIKLTIQVLPDLKEKLDDYATIYEETYGKADEVNDLIPYMLESFVESDSAFKKLGEVCTIEGKNRLQNLMKPQQKNLLPHRA